MGGNRPGRRVAVSHMVPSNLRDPLASTLEISHRHCGSTAPTRVYNSGLEGIFVFELAGVTTVEQEVAAEGFEPPTKGLGEV